MRQLEASEPASVFCTFRSQLIVLSDLVIVVAGLISLFGFAARYFWAADMCCQFRVQLLFFMLPATLFYGLVRRGPVASFALVCLAANTIPLLPYLIIAPSAEELNRGGASRLMMLNVLVSNKHFDKVVAYVKQQDPDLFVVIEADQDWTAGLRPIHGTYPHRRLIDDRGTSSMAVYSKLPFDDIETHFSTRYRLPSFDITLTIQGEPVQIFVTHPYVPVTPETAALRNEQLEHVANAMDLSRPRILLGDFNCAPWSPYIKGVLTNADLTPAGFGNGLRPTWYRRSRWYGPLRKTWVFALKLDHVLLSDDFDVTNYEIGPCLGSDHRPVTVDFVLANESN